MALEDYSVGVKIHLTNMVSSGLLAMARDVTGLERQVVGLQDKFKALKMIAVGWGTSRIGTGMLEFMSASIKVSEEYTHQVSQLGILGMKQANIAEVISQSWKTSRDVMTSSAAENIEAYREMRAVFGSGHEHEALAILPMAQRASAILSSLTGQMNKVKDVGYDMAKAVELTTVGGMTDAQMRKRSEQFLQASVAFGGKISMQDFHGALKMTRGASLNYNDDFISHYLPTLIQEMKSGNGGGQQAGTLLRNFDRAVVQQVIPLNKLQNWQDAGLIKSGHVVWNKNHTGLKRITPGGVEGQDLASLNPYDWWQKYGETAMKKLMSKNGLTDIQAISALSTNQMTADLFKKFHFQHAQFERDKKLIEDITAGGGSKAKYEQLLKTDPLLAQRALQAQWSNIQARIGYEVLPKLIPLMVQFADGLTSISKWMEEHPVKFKALVGGFISLGVAMTVIGKVMMAAGMVKLLGLGPMLMELVTILGGPVVWAVAAAIGASYLIYRNWDKIKPAAKKMADEFGVIMSDIWKRMKKVGEYIGSWSIWEPVKNAWNIFTTNLTKGFTGVFDTIIGYMNLIPGAPHFLSSQERGLQNQANDLLGVINLITGGPKTPKPFAFDGSTFNGGYAGTMTSQGKSSSSGSLTDGMKGMYENTSVPVPPKQNRPVFEVHNYIDGKEIHHQVIKTMTKEATKPPSGPSAFDSSMILTGPGQVSSLLAR